MDAMTIDYPRDLVINTRQGQRRLPNELLLIVKEYLPDDDLRTHVCFYHTCRDTAGFYGSDEEQEPFWESLCKLNGLYRTDEDMSLGLTWQQIAFDCIVRDGFCSHPQCGPALLEQNRHWKEESTQWQVWDEDLQCYLSNRFRSNTIFPAVSLNDERRSPLATSALETFLRSGEEVSRKGKEVSRHIKLKEHPIAYRSSAVFPPCRKSFLSYKRESWVLHEAKLEDRPLTVAHILDSVLSDPQLDKELTVKELEDVLAGHGSFVYYTFERFHEFCEQDREDYPTLRHLWADSRSFDLDYLGNRHTYPQFRFHVMPNFSGLELD
ncbi:unnamed protein product [Somion occarium]|uniref:Uncharacterized protein n=1 Tax=Somion occarium TaxID=3059160 RepID=A0ABP1DDN9_9APHY